MLNLTRSEDQKLTIGNDITIIVKRIKDGQVILGIDAPREVEILRDDAKNKIARSAVY